LIFFENNKEFEVGEMVHTKSFSLTEAMSALEVFFFFFLTFDFDFLFQIFFIILIEPFKT